MRVSANSQLNLAQLQEALSALSKPKVDKEQSPASTHAASQNAAVPEGPTTQPGSFDDPYAGGLRPFEDFRPFEHDHHHDDDHDDHRHEDKHVRKLASKLIKTVKKQLHEFFEESEKLDKDTKKAIKELRKDFKHDVKSAVKEFREDRDGAALEQRIRSAFKGLITGLRDVLPAPEGQLPGEQIPAPDRPIPMDVPPTVRPVPIGENPMADAITFAEAGGAPAATEPQRDAGVQTGVQAASAEVTLTARVSTVTISGAAPIAAEPAVRPHEEHDEHNDDDEHEDHEVHGHEDHDHGHGHGDPLSRLIAAFEEALASLLRSLGADGQGPTQLPLPNPQVGQNAPAGMFDVYTDAQARPSFVDQVS